MTNVTTDFGIWVADQAAASGQALQQACADTSLAQAPRVLQRAVAHALHGGKHLRPALVRLACEAHGGQFEMAAPGAVACEMIHAYSLIHDDLPCMDDDYVRRGQPSVHAAFGEATAVLAGDALQAMAFEVLGRQADAQLAQDQALCLAVAVGPAGMVGGQILDLESSANDAVDLVREIHRRKTGALIGASLHLGARASGADPESWDSFAALCGELFQAVDDVLDVTASSEQLGKTAGKDAASGRANLVAALGLEGARRETAELADSAREAAIMLPVLRHADLLVQLPSWFEKRCS